MTLVLDASPLITIQRTQQTSALTSLGKIPVIIPGGVWDELTLSSTSKPETIADAEKMMTAIAGARTDILPGTPEATTYARIYDPNAKMDAGESEVIAYAIHHPETIVVLQDRLPIHRAIEELRGRVLGLYGFLGWLVEKGLPPDRAQVIASVHHKVVPPPAWWNSVVKPTPKVKS